MRKIFLPLATAFCFLLLGNVSNGQFNTVLRDLSIVSYHTDAYPTSIFDLALPELDNSFPP